jgi:hypothetical protein
MDTLICSLMQPDQRFAVKGVEVGNVTTDDEAFTYDADDAFDATFGLRPHRKMSDRTKTVTNG